MFLKRVASRGRGVVTKQFGENYMPVGEFLTQNCVVLLRKIHKLLSEEAKIWDKANTSNSI